MNQYGNAAYLEQLHDEAALDRKLEPMRATDRADWRSAQRQLLSIAARWTWGAPINLRDARGLK